MKILVANKRRWQSKSGEQGPLLNSPEKAQDFHCKNFKLREDVPSYKFLINILAT